MCATKTVGSINWIQFRTISPTISRCLSYKLMLLVQRCVRLFRPSTFDAKYLWNDNGSDADADTIQINKNEGIRKSAQCRTKPIRLNAFSSECFDETTKWYNLNNDEQHALGESMRTLFFSWFDSKLIWRIRISSRKHSHLRGGSLETCTSTP